MKKLMCVLFGAALCLGQAWAQDDKSLPGDYLDTISEEDIEPLARVCEQCHGVGGFSEREDVPAIAGRDAKYIMASLEQFYFYERHCPSVEFMNQEGQMSRQSMCDITNMLNKPEALALGQYFEHSEKAEDSPEEQETDQVDDQK